MSVNKLALLRYKVIDQCLQNRYRKWTLEDLIERVSDALYEYEGIKTGVSRRTIQADIQLMRSDKLGYEAPIEVVDKKYYCYTDKKYSITQSKVSSQDIEKLTEVVSILKQFKGFTYFEDVTEMVGRLEDKIMKQRQDGAILIDFEKNDLLKGLEWIDVLLKNIREKKCLDIDYQSFKAKNPSTFTVYPYLLKEYRNRWFLLVRKLNKTDVNILALDRMSDVRVRQELDYREATDFEVSTFFDDIIGVTKNTGSRPVTITLKAAKEQAPYILTKPLHSSQTVLKHTETEFIFSIKVALNYELEREILGFCEGIVVLSPRSLKQQIQKRLKNALESYKEGVD